MVHSEPESPASHLSPHSMPWEEYVLGVYDLPAQDALAEPPWMGSRRVINLKDMFFVHKKAR